MKRKLFETALITSTSTFLRAKNQKASIRFGMATKPKLVDYISYIKQHKQNY